MENQNSNSKLKGIIILLLVLLVGSLIYIFKITADAKTLETTVTKVSSEKENMIKKLEELNSNYDAALAENTTMTDELMAEKERVVKLIAELKSSKGDNASLRKYKDQYKVLEEKMKSMMQEVTVLKNENQQLTTNLESTKVDLDDSKKYNEVLVGQNEELAKTVEKGSKLSVTNLKTASYKVRSSGKQIETDKASKTDILKVSFTIAENKIAKSGDKTYYVQVIDANNNVLGDKATISFGDTSLTYSFTTTVKYENKTVEVLEQLPGKDFTKGTYFVNVFDKAELVSKSSFSLR
jgi:myosin heavy subunit